MAKLTKAQARAHQEACNILRKDALSDDEKLFVLEHWQESAKHINTIAGAFFTPVGLARDLSVEVNSHCRVIDLCAGIGALSLFAYWRGNEIVCVELNLEYAEVGRKIVPEATWIVGSVFDLPDLGHFDFAIGNPPFGATSRNAQRGPRFTGSAFELHVIDIASDVADFGVFIVPQQTAGFKYSGCPAGGWRETIKDGFGSGYLECRDEVHDRLLAQSGIVLESSCGIDTDLYAKDWHGVSIKTEVVTVDFIEARARRQPAQAEMFARSAA